MKNSELPAFASAITSPDGEILDIKTGLTKREYFAGLITQGLVMKYGVDASSIHHLNHLSELAVKQTDSLLAELEKEEQNKVQARQALKGFVLKNKLK